MGHKARQSEEGGRLPAKDRIVFFMNLGATVVFLNLFMHVQRSRSQVINHITPKPSHCCKPTKVWFEEINSPLQDLYVLPTVYQQQFIVVSPKKKKKCSETHQTAAGKDTGFVTHALAGMKGSLPEIIWYSITPTLLPSGEYGNKECERHGRRRGVLMT